ncbi:ZirU family protein [Pseudomonas resinovorans]|uniref:ZirU family protein n=1 Tax=Metapseudomonas resinovorans TaxID=53412 RepID=A0ABT4YD91_METRE|nr:ZirU family protein [Pseudomonas resinovorans]MDA8486731.1 ZirU family protein [Pseudomonas resinovorans]
MTPRNIAKYTGVPFQLVAAFGLAASAQLALALDSAPTQPVEGRAPAVSSIVLKNETRPGERPAEGDTMTVESYSFNDPDGDIEDQSASGTSFQWKLDGQDISGATEKSYQVDPADAGKVLTVEVTPRTSQSDTDPYEGLAVLSPPVTIGASDQPTSIEIHVNGTPITGRPVVGTQLTAVPVCPSGACDPNLVFTWSVGGTEVGTGVTYTPAKEDQKKTITVSTPTVRAVQR